MWWKEKEVTWTHCWKLNFEIFFCMENIAFCILKFSASLNMAWVDQECSYSEDLILWEGRKWERVQCNLQSTLPFIVSVEWGEKRPCWKSLAIQSLCKQAAKFRHPHWHHKTENPTYATLLSTQNRKKSTTMCCPLLSMACLSMCHIVREREALRLFNLWGTWVTKSEENKVYRGFTGAR